MKAASLLLFALAGAGLSSACQAPADRPGPSAEVGLPSLPPAAEDSCGARTYSALLGEHHDRAPPAPAGKVIRQICSMCPMTMDYNAERVNIIYDTASGRVTRLTCG